MSSCQVVQIEKVLSPTINFAMQQNGVPMIRHLAIRNPGDADLRDVLLRVTAAPAFFRIWEKTFPVLPAQTLLDAGIVDLQPDAAFLTSLTERLNGELTIEMLDQSGRVIYQETNPVGILAFDEWGGLSVLPEMLCAFVTPNHPAVSRLLEQAARYLQTWTGDPSLDGYQRNSPNRVRQQAAAIYEAVRARAIIYSQPPASFEQTGQRIRLADTVLDRQMGTCLDLTLLLAACLEAAGLNALINISRGHAFAGVWLTDQCFAESVQDDVSALDKRCAPGMAELLLIESTAAAAGKQTGFEDAEKQAAQHLRNSDDFICSIDLRRARASGIRPLPQRIMTAEGWRIAESEAIPTNQTAPAPSDLSGRQIPATSAQLPLTRQKQWERKLLDLSLRNPLLNFRATRGTVRLFARQLAHFEDSLTDGTEFQILERPKDWIDDQRDPRSFESRYNLDPYESLLDFEFSQKRLRTPLDVNDLNLAMTNLYRTARTALEENGANTLYLALGFLRWYETPSSTQPRFAPAVLIPVEIVRRPAGKGFVLRSRDEDPQVNITLLEMLRQDFGIVIGELDPLPRDEKGIDLPAILNAIRMAILQQSRWTVQEEAYLGIFSFTRFIMWNDIRNRADDLIRNPVVASLAAGRLTWQPEPLLAAGTDLDDLYAPDQTFLPVSADASQLVAVHASGAGHSFVLHGPPGTGKSQTITNIIGNALARGKTVLFVAEKMAALAVVQRRLEKIGLGPFCLELHSNKTRKRDVLEHLRLTMEIGQNASPADFARQAERLHQMRLDLNAYVRQLYHPYAFGLSLFEAISRYGELTDARDGIRIDPSAFSGLDQAAVERWFSLVGELATAARECGGPFGHPLQDMRGSVWSSSLRAAAADNLQGLSARLSDFADAYRKLSDLLDLPRFLPEARFGAVAGSSGIGQHLLSEADLLGQICRVVLDLPRLPAVLLRQDEWPVMAARLKSLFSQGQTMSDSRRELLESFRETVLTLDGPSMLNAWNQNQLKWLIPRWTGERRLIRILQQHALPGVQLTGHDLLYKLRLLVTYQDARSQTSRQYQVWEAPLAGFWQDLDTDWQSGLKYADLIPALNQHLLTLTGQAASANGLGSLLADCLEEPSRQALQQYLTVCADVMQKQQALTDLLGIHFDQLAVNPAEKPLDGWNWPIWLAVCLARWQAHLDQLREWCIWRSVCERAGAAGLASTVTALEQGVVQADEVAEAFAKSFYQEAAAWIINREPVLSGFSGQLFEEKIRQFQQTFDHYETLTRQEIQARLSAGIPAWAAEAAQNSEMGILQRAIKSTGRGLSIRRLFDQLPNLLPRLAPCMLMSPISAAQYLDPKQTLFDLVVFDEASQMPTSEAVGALARGRHAVIVGDPRQLPPTSFFAINTFDEENDAVEDLESILDDCLALSMPQTHLLWHYRSRHESLIAFSNRQYYENRLLTFPSPNDLVSRVRLIPVAGLYDRGRTKQNLPEARAVVAEVLRRLADPDLCRLSMGIVTFSAVQQNLIEDCLTDAFRERPDLEEKATQGIEPVFVKNLENVQGDERDVILFSVGYGPDRSGRVSMNFGPLNREGGWRRLNVAVSRARCEMLVFSTIRADQLDAARTGAQGVAGLRAFLTYAERGLAALPIPASEAGAASFDDQQGIGANGLATQIANALEENGYQTQVQVGSSGYRIDIGVVHPKRPGEYLLGILCNGTTYRDARTARDREILQKTILRQLGWQLHQIWAVDWWENTAKETRRLLQHLEELLQHDSADLTKDRHENGQAPVPEKAPEPIPAAGPAPHTSILANHAAQTSGHIPDGIYRPVQLQPWQLQPDDLMKPGKRRQITGRLLEIIDGEGPVSRRLLYRRFCHSCGISRISSSLESLLDELTAGCGRQKTVHGEQTIFWAVGQDPQTCEIWRTAGGEPDDRRLPEDLPPEEIAAAARNILDRQIGLPKPDLIRETARLLGYARLGPILERVCSQGIDLAIARGWAIVGNHDILACTRRDSHSP